MQASGHKIAEAYNNLIEKHGAELTHKASTLNEVVVKTWAGEQQL